jgi:drug/metabolite transporter (DMT)-like permease
VRLFLFDMTSDRRASSLSSMDALLVLMVIAWALNYSILKRVFQEFPPMVFNTLRMVLSSAVFYGLIRAARWRARLTDPERSTTFYTPNTLTTRDRMDLVWLGIVGHGLYQLCFGNGLAITAASSAALIIGCTPVIVAMMSVAFGRERLGPLHWLGAALSTVGIYLVVRRGGSGSGSGGEETVAGDLLVLVAAVCWAAYTVGGTRVMSRHSPLYVTGITMICGTVPYALASLPQFFRLEWRAISLTAWLLIIPAGLLALCFAHLVWYAAVKQLGPARTSIYANAIPLTAMFIAVVWLGESISRSTMIGTAAIISGVLLTRLAPKRTPAAEPAQA